MKKNNNTTEKNAPKAASFYRPTAMSIAMAAVGIIPDERGIVRDFYNTALLRHHADKAGIRPSVQVAF